jgi:hypothetical protein
MLVEKEMALSFSDTDMSSLRDFLIANVLFSCYRHVIPTGFLVAANGRRTQRPHKWSSLLRGVARHEVSNPVYYQ